MQQGDYLTKETVIELGEDRYVDFCEYLKRSGYAIGNAFGEYRYALNEQDTHLVLNDDKLMWVRASSTLCVRPLFLHEIVKVLGSANEHTVHPHAESMRLYAEDALVSTEPWTMWENRKVGSRDNFKECQTHPRWFADFEYRRKRKTIQIGNNVINAPMTTPPAHGDKVYVVWLTAPFLNSEIYWNDSDMQRSWLRRRLIHDNQVSAIKHANALLNSISL